MGGGRKRRRAAADDALSFFSPSSESASSSSTSSASSSSPSTSDLLAALDALGRRLDVWASPALQPTRRALYPLIRLQQDRGAHFEPRDWAAEPAPDDAALGRLLAPAVLAALGRAAAALLPGGASAGGASATGDGDDDDDNDAGMSSAEIAASKAFRRALHPLVIAQYARDGRSPPGESASGRISRAFRASDWVGALAELDAMAARGEAARLGALQRWVRDCDLAASAPGAAAEGRSAVGTSWTSSGHKSESSDNLALLLLDAVMRVSGSWGRSSGSCGSDAAVAAVALGADEGAVAGAGARSRPRAAILTRWPVFGACASSSVSSSASFEASLPPPPSGWGRERVAKRMHVLATVRGPQRRPAFAAGDDLRIWAARPLAPAAIEFDAAPAAPTRLDVPHVPGAFLLSGALSPGECRQLVHTALELGFQSDGVDGISTCVWLADERQLLAPLFARVAPLLPREIAGCALRGINARLRFFCYEPGALYRPHIDGAWPGSGLDAEGLLTDDAFDGARVSRLTFLVYLTGGFGGGATTFFLPSPAEAAGGRGRGHVDAFGVQPHEGAVLCFPHGDGAGSLVHEGSPVLPGGRKFIIRTDVLYDARPGKGQAGAAGLSVVGRRSDAHGRARSA